MEQHPHGSRTLTASTFLCGSLSTEMGREIPNPSDTIRAGISTACFVVFKQTRSCCWTMCEPSIPHTSQSSVPLASPQPWGEQPSWGQQTQHRAAQPCPGSGENQDATGTTQWLLKFRTTIVVRLGNAFHSRSGEGGWGDTRRCIHETKFWRLSTCLVSSFRLLPTQVRVLLDGIQHLQQIISPCH